MPPTDPISGATQVQTVYKRNLCKQMLKLITEKSVVNLRKDKNFKQWI